jgi:response regulator RpfG family c-di-GMP phosphodiesterase
MTDPRGTLRIGLVADQPIVAAGVRRALADAGLAATVVPIASARLALAELERLVPDVILQDLSLPDGDGLELVSAYRSSTALAGVPVLVLSGSDEPATKAESFARGAADYLVKLPPPLELAARIKAHAAAGRAWRERDALLAELGSARRSLERSNRELDEMNRILSLANEAIAEDAETVKEGLAAARRVGEGLLAVHDVDVLATTLLGEAMALTGARAGALLEREGDGFILDHGRTAGGAALSGGVVRINPGGLLSAAVRSGSSEERYPSEREAPPLDSSLAELLGVAGHSALVVPLRTAFGGGDGTLGLLVLADAADADGTLRAGFGQDRRRQVAHLAAMATLGLERARLVRSIVMRMVAMAELRDPHETGAHVRRVSGYSVALFDAWARSRRLDAEIRKRLVDRLAIAAILHDVGKVGIADAILKKPGPLDPEERAAMERHTTIGAELFRGLRSDIDEAAREVALCHHERWDGTGYPGVAGRGLRGEEIPIFARIVAVADVFDALTSPRPYKPAWAEERVIEQLRRDAGSHFDPEIVALLDQCLPELRRIRDRNPEMAPDPASGG